jgi:hypothetical protein
MKAFIESSKDTFALGLGGGVGRNDTLLRLLCIGDVLLEDGGVRERD